MNMTSKRYGCRVFVRRTGRRAGVRVKLTVNGRKLPEFIA